MSIVVESPTSAAELRELVLFHDRVYAERSARWPASLELQLPILTGESPFAEGREIRPLWVRDDGEVVARAVAVLDARYQRHWLESLGHVVWFEALPDSEEAVRALLDAACDWLASRDATAARAGMGMLDLPFAMDAYETLPPSLLRQNPEYYHRLLKHGRFEVEQGWVDYKARVTPELIARWESALEGAQRAGFTISAARDVPAEQRVRDIAATWADTFKAHFGFTAFSEAEIAGLLEGFAAGGILDTTAIAYDDEGAVGMCVVAPDDPHHAALAPGRRVDDSERLNWLAIGVRERARGRGVNYAMAAHAFLELVRRGHSWVSYTLVLDDNWPSRRTGEGLGARLCANYLTYRRDF